MFESRFFHASIGREANGLAGLKCYRFTLPKIVMTQRHRCLLQVLTKDFHFRRENGGIMDLQMGKLTATFVNFSLNVIEDDDFARIGSEVNSRNLHAREHQGNLRPARSIKHPANIVVPVGGV